VEKPIKGTKASWEGQTNSIKREYLSIIQKINWKWKKINKWKLHKRGVSIIQKEKANKKGKWKEGNQTE
jgi:hypothetical protein